jgi:hypothetical protein
MHDYEKDTINRRPGLSGWLKMVRDNHKKWWSIYRNEKLMCRNWTVLSIGHHDCMSLRRLYNAKDVHYFPPYLSNLPEDYEVKEKKVLNVVYIGSNLKNNVNKDGAEYLINNIIPLINRDMSNEFVFHITGKYAGDELRNVINTSNLIIHDFIDDIYQFLLTMDIACLPVQAGRGCKIKMFECLAIGIPTVGFPKTFYGIPPKRVCYGIANCPEGFARELKIMIEHKYRQGLSGNAKQYIKQIASKEVLLRELRNCL